MFVKPNKQKIVSIFRKKKKKKNKVVLKIQLFFFIILKTTDAISLNQRRCSVMSNYKLFNSTIFRWLNLIRFHYDQSQPSLKQTTYRLKLPTMYSNKIQKRLQFLTKSSICNKHPCCLAPDLTQKLVVLNRELVINTDIFSA